MQKFRIVPIRGIMNYHRCIIHFQTYLLVTTWEAGVIEGSPKVILLEFELQENLAVAILFIGSVCKTFQKRAQHLDKEVHQNNL